MKQKKLKLLNKKRSRSHPRASAKRDLPEIQNHRRSASVDSIGEISSHSSFEFDEKLNIDDFYVKTKAATK